MSQQTINIGSSTNAGDGDPLRTAFDKINDNFTELYDRAVNTDAQTLTLVGNTLTISSGNSVSLSQYSTFSGSYNDLTNKPTIPSLGNIVFDANGITNPTGEIIDIQAPFAQLQSTDGTYIWVEDGYGAGIEVTYAGGSRIWKFDSNGTLQVPGMIAGTDGISIIPDNAETFAYLNLPSDANSAAFGVSLGNDNGKIELRTNNQLTSTAYTWKFDNDGTLTFPDSTVQTTAWTTIPGPYADDAAAASAGVAVGYPYYKTGTGGQVFVRLS